MSATTPGEHLDSVVGENANDIDIVQRAMDNDDFRQVLMTGRSMQVVLMTLPVGEEIGLETHEHGDQMLFLIRGSAEVVLDGQQTSAEAGHLVFVPAGVEHNVSNTGDGPLRLVTAYAPPEHEAGAVHRTRGDAEAAEAAGEDEPPSAQG